MFQQIDYSTGLYVLQSNAPPKQNTRGLPTRPVPLVERPPARRRSLELDIDGVVDQVDDLCVRSCVRACARACACVCVCLRVGVDVGEVYKHDILARAHTNTPTPAHTHTHARTHTHTHARARARTRAHIRVHGRTIELTELFLLSLASPISREEDAEMTTKKNKTKINKTIRDDDE
jgi:hypothetical protein